MDFCKTSWFHSQIWWITSLSGLSLAILLPIPDWWSLLGLSSHCDGDLVLWYFVKLRTQKTWLNKKCISDVQDQFSWTLRNLSFAAVVEKVEEKKERIGNGCRVLDKLDTCIYLSSCLQALANSAAFRTSDIMRGTDASSVGMRKP